MNIFHEIAMLNESSEGNFYALVQVDTDKRVEAGCAGVVVSLHVTYPEAEAARAAIAKPLSRLNPYRLSEEG